MTAIARLRALFLPSPRPAPEEALHAVTFYADDETLLDQLEDYVKAGTAAGEKTVIIATPEHRQALADRLPDGEHGFFGMDAADTLSRFMIGGRPDPELFDQSIGELVRAEVAKGMRAYGEMVALLWAEDNVLGTLELEELWNGLQREVHFPLLCAYPQADFDQRPGLGDVCKTHNHVAPSPRPAATEA